MWRSSAFFAVEGKLILFSVSISLSSATFRLLWSNPGSKYSSDIALYNYVPIAHKDNLAVHKNKTKKGHLSVCPTDTKTPTHPHTTYTSHTIHNTRLQLTASAMRRCGSDPPVFTRGSSPNNAVCSAECPVLAQRQQGHRGHVRIVPRDTEDTSAHCRDTAAGQQKNKGRSPRNKDRHCPVHSDRST